tara:strand:+ start:67 stop:279 length:213 start_codon:yes stop_codon:yes gene_type:complete
MKRFDEVVQSLPEKNEHKKSKEYKKLSPKMKEAVDDIFRVMDAKPSDFLNTFEKTIKTPQRGSKSKRKTY